MWLSGSSETAASPDGAAEHRGPGVQSGVSCRRSCWRYLHSTVCLQAAGFSLPLTFPLIGPGLLGLCAGKQVLDLLLVHGRQDLKIKGPRLNQTKEDKMAVRHGCDERLNPIISPPMPLMEVLLSHCSWAGCERFSTITVKALSKQMVYRCEVCAPVKFNFFWH